MVVSIQYRYLKTAEAEEVCALIARVFHKYVAPDFSPEGVAEFLNYAQPEAMLERCASGHFILVGVEQEKIIGMIEIRDFEHISMLFVERRGRGISRELLNRALDVCQKSRSNLKRVTVHSSLFAEPIYRKLGFRPTGPSRTERGITFVPMEINLPKMA